MTVAYLKTLALICLTKLLWVIALTLSQFGIHDGILLLSPKIVEESLCCIVNWENLTSTC